MEQPPVDVDIVVCFRVSGSYDGIDFSEASCPEHVEPRLLRQFEPGEVDAGGDEVRGEGRAVVDGDLQIHTASEGSIQRPGDPVPPDLRLFEHDVRRTEGDVGEPLRRSRVRRRGAPVRGQVRMHQSHRQIAIADAGHLGPALTGGGGDCSPFGADRTTTRRTEVPCPNPRLLHEQASVVR